MLACIGSERDMDAAVVQEGDTVTLRPRRSTERPLLFRPPANTCKHGPRIVLEFWGR